MESTATTELRREEVTSSIMESGAMDGGTISIDIAYNPTRFYDGLKRLVDIVLAVAGIVFLIPVLLVIAVCIKLEDGGTILYFREMIGLRGRRFLILKFRTMIPNADAFLEQHPELMQEYQQNMKLQSDPRVTKVGKFLRRTYLDELPQLFNVLAGQMSFVGPRAIHQRELPLYGEYAEKRHRVKPGMTGLWQVSTDRYRCYEDRIVLDMRYIDKRSFFLDLLILVKTIKVLIALTGV